MFLILVFVLLFAVLGVFLFVGALFFQNLINTQPAEGLAWRAPAAAAVLAVFFTFWAFIVTRSDAKPGDIPYDALHRFNPQLEMFPDGKPAPKLTALRADGTRTLYTRIINDRLDPEYIDEKKKPFNRSGVVAFEMEREGAVIKFDRVEGDENDNIKFMSPEGWVIVSYDESGPNHSPWRWRSGYVFLNLLLNLLHFGVWFVCLWLLLQFRFMEALGFGVVLWLVSTIIVLPMLLDQAATIAATRVK